MSAPDFLTRPWTLQRFLIILAGAAGGLIVALYVHGGI